MQPGQVAQHSKARTGYYQGPKDSTPGSLLGSRIEARLSCYPAWNHPQRWAAAAKTGFAQLDLSHLMQVSLHVEVLVIRGCATHSRRIGSWSRGRSDRKPAHSLHWAGGYPPASSGPLGAPLVTERCAYWAQSQGRPGRALDTWCHRRQSKAPQCELGSLSSLSTSRLSQDWSQIAMGQLSCQEIRRAI